jgi:hypothetical protein
MRAFLTALAASGSADRVHARPADDPAGQLIDIIKHGDIPALQAMSGGVLLQTFPGSEKMRKVSAADALAMVRGCDPSRLTVPMMKGENSSNTGFVRTTCRGRTTERDRCRDVAYEFSISFIGGPRIKFYRFDAWSAARCGPEALRMPPVAAPPPPLSQPTISIEAAQARGAKVRAMIDAVRNDHPSALSVLLARDAMLSEQIDGPGVRPTTAALRDIMKGCEKRGPLKVDDNRVVVSFACTPPRPEGDLLLLVYFSDASITRIVPTTP